MNSEPDDNKCSALQAFLLMATVMLSSVSLSAQAKVVEVPNESPFQKEGPALTFGPVSVKGGQAVRQCAINLGSHSAEVIIAVIKTNRKLASRADQLSPHMEVCLEYPMPNVLAGNIVGLVFTSEPDSEKVLRTLASTFQVVDQSGTALVVVPSVLLPEVQLPTTK